MGRNRSRGWTTLVDAHLEVIRTEFGRFPRQVSGYSLEHLLPENGPGSGEGAGRQRGHAGASLWTRRSSWSGSARPGCWSCSGTRTWPSAADAVPAVLAHAPLAVEGLDARLVDVVRIAKGSAAGARPAARRRLADGRGRRRNPAEAQVVGAALVRDAAALDSIGVAGRPGGNGAVADPGRRGGTGRPDSGRPAGLARLGGRRGAAGEARCVSARVRGIDGFLRGRRPALRPFRRRLHPRPDRSAAGSRRRGVPAVHRSTPRDWWWRTAVHARANTATAGPAANCCRSCTPTAPVELFAGVKAVFDPRDLLNPGVLVRPDPIDADLRRPQAKSLLATDGFSFSRDAGDFTTAVHRCVGVGKCRADNRRRRWIHVPVLPGVRDEKDVTRGRARVLQELTNGALIADWTSAEVHESLDLCLSCKACASDCPAGVDMAQYKSEVLHRAYRRRIRPISHYSMGWLPRWISLIGALPGFVPAVINRLLSVRPLSRVLLPPAGIDPRRTRTDVRRRSAFRPRRCRRSRRKVSARETIGRPGGAVGRLLHRRAEPGGGACRRAGARAARVTGSSCPDDDGLLRPDLDHHRPARRPPASGCCACSTSWNPMRRRGFRSSRWSRPVCAVLRSDLVELLPDDPRAVRVAGAVTTLAELLTSRTNGWRPPDLPGTRIIVQPHCHQHAVMGFAADRAVARAERRRGHRSRRMLRPGRQFRDGEGPLRDVAGGRRERPAAGTAAAIGGHASCWPTDSPAGCRWISWRACGGSACPSCSRRTCRLNPSVVN